MKVLSEEERDRLTDNIAGDLIGAEDNVQSRAVASFATVDESYGRMVGEKLNKLRKEMQGEEKKSTQPACPFKAADLSPPREIPNKSNGH